MNPLEHQWSIDKIQARDWLNSGSVASVWASNWAGDSLAFDMTWHPDGFSIIYNVEVNFYSEDLMIYNAEEIIENSLLGLAEQELTDWWNKVSYLKSFLIPEDWKVGKGLPVPDIKYAILALLYVERSRMSPLYVTQLLSGDMSVPLSTTKERIRKTRDKEFLTSPGKGLNGQGEITNKAIKTLRENGVKQ